MRLFLLFSTGAFVYLSAIINDDHLPKIIPSTEYSNTKQAIGWCGNATSFSITKEMILGEQLFKKHCNSCHNRNMVSDLTGPALKGVTERWADYPKEDLYNWIRNSQKMVREKHPKAVKLFKIWTPTLMNSFDFSDEEIDALLAYIEK